MKYPSPQSAKETKRLNNKNVFGCIIVSTKTSNGAPKMRYLEPNLKKSMPLM